MNRNKIIKLICDATCTGKDVARLITKFIQSDCLYSLYDGKFQIIDVPHNCIQISKGNHYFHRGVSQSSFYIGPVPRSCDWWKDFIPLMVYCPQLFGRDQYKYLKKNDEIWFTTLEIMSSYEGIITIY